MTPPYYTAKVASLTRGWSYSAVQVASSSVSKLSPAQIAALPAVTLGDGFTFNWQFAGAQVPAPLDPCTATVRLVAKSAAELPPVERGDFLNIELRVGAAGQRILQPAPMRVTSAEAELTVHPIYAATLTLQLLEYRAELQNLTVYQGVANLGLSWGGANFSHPRWRPRLAELAVQSGVSMACPGWWADAEDVLQLGYPGVSGNLFNGMEQPQGPASGAYVGSAPLFLWDRSVYKCVDELLATHYPANVSHTAYTGYLAGYPASWGKVAPVAQYGTTTTSPSDPVAVIPDPASLFKLFLMPASRRALSAGGGQLPLVFAVRGGRLTLQPTYVAQEPSVGGVMRSGHARIGLDAAWCDLPATVRKSRDGSVNRVTLTGQETYQSAAGAAVVFRRTSRSYDNAAVQPADGVVERVVDTQLSHGTAGDDYHPAPSQRFYSLEAPNVVAPQLLTDASARLPWVWDQFTVKASRIPDDLAPGVLSRLAPRAPTEADTDSHLLRHVTIYRPAASVRPGAGLIGGFITKGQLDVRKGDVTVTLNLAPGATVWADATPSSVTVAQVDAATYQAQLCNTIDPLITVADLAMVGA